MLVTFLDIDGVLNSRDWWERRPKHEETEALSDAERRYRWARRNIDPAAVARVQRLVDVTRTVLVLSSSWRTMTKLHEMTYVVLDDDNIDQHDDHFVRTDPNVGLTDADTDRAISILSYERDRG